jgi:pimeloyl-ACP methyl ester carboxylesterase
MDAAMFSLDLKERYETQYRKLDSVVTGLEGEYVETAMGPVWVTTAGEKDAPPLILIHGLHTTAPFCLEYFSKLAEKFRVYCPDIPGQAGKTSGVALMPTNHAYALWLEAVLDSLKIESCPAVGLSFGGGVLLDLAVLSPDRITAASLVVPAGFFRPIWRPLKKLFMPFIGFKLHTDQSHFDQLMNPLMGGNWPELEAYYYSVFQAGLPMTLIPPGPFEKADLSKFSAPVQLLVASEDLYFAPDKMAKYADDNLRNLKQVVEVDDLHIPNEKNRLKIQTEVFEFMLKEKSM